MSVSLGEVLLYLAPNANWSTTGETYADIDWQDESITKPTEAEVEAARVPAEAALKLRVLRGQRDYLLAQTDWWVLPDRTATAEQTAYRQALRDITDTYSSMDDDGFAWPTKPE